MVSLYKYVHLPRVTLSAASQSCWHCVTSFPRQWLCLTLSLDIMQLEWISEDAIPACGCFQHQQGLQWWMAMSLPKSSNRWILKHSCAAALLPQMIKSAEECF